MSAPRIYFNNCNYKSSGRIVRYVKSVSDCNTPGNAAFESGAVALNEINVFGSNVVFSSENKTFEWYSDTILDSDFLLPGDSLNTIIFLRDPFNSLASLCMLVERKPEKIHQLGEFVRSWISLANIFMTEGVGRKAHYVFYNEFVSSLSFREKLSGAFSIKNSGLRSDLSTFGGGGNTMFGGSKDYVPDMRKLERRWEDLKDPTLLKKSVDAEFFSVAEAFCNHVGRLDLFDKPYAQLFVSTD
ncbi:MAG: hypothetical protein E2579_06535 [Pseudomonas sp.]|nr:hypothetical protein [Pseudomonas sp.]MPT17401.1 hypothetical protein [Pseudomonas sp.]